MFSKMFVARADGDRPNVIVGETARRHRAAGHAASDGLKDPIVARPGRPQRRQVRTEDAFRIDAVTFGAARLKARGTGANGIGIALARVPGRALRESREQHEDRDPHIPMVTLRPLSPCAS